ncbi:MAG TPA: membrane protein insertase YidC, partial [Gammaproteobacteria bacterium]
MSNPRLVLLVALGFIMMLMWQEWQKDYGPRPKSPDTGVTSSPQGQTALPQQEPMSAVDGTSQELPQLASGSSLHQMAPSTPARSQVTAAVPAGRLIKVVTDKLDVTIDPKGGEISKLSLRAYPVALDKLDEPFSLMIKDVEEIYVAQTGLLSRQGAPNHLANFTAEQFEYSLAEGQDELQVRLNWSNDQGVNVVKIFKFSRGTHVVDVVQKVSNNTGVSWVGNQYRQLVRTVPKESGGMANTMAYTFNGAAYY